MHTRKQSLSLLLVWLIAMVTTMPLAAQNTADGTDTVYVQPVRPNEKPWPVSKHSVRLGGFWAINTTLLGAGINGKEYSSFEFENLLDMNRHTYSGLLNFNWRLGRHHRLDFNYYTIRRHSEATLAKEITFGEHTYPVSATIDAHLNTNVVRLSYGYAFISNHKLELGALAGFHVMFFNTGMGVLGETIDQSYSDNVNFMAPLPDVGLWGTYAFTDRWATTAELSYFYIKYNSLSGRILNAQLALQYRISKHWEIDLGYTDFNIGVDVNTKRLDANFEWNYHGPFITGIYKFGNL